MMHFKSYEEQQAFISNRIKQSEAFLRQTQINWSKLVDEEGKVQVMITEAALKKCTGLVLDFNTESLPGLFCRVKPSYLGFYLSGIGEDFYMKKLRNAITEVVEGGFLKVGNMGSIFHIGPIFGGRQGSRKDVFVSLNDHNPFTKRSCVFFEVLMQNER